MPKDTGPSEIMQVFNASKRMYDETFLKPFFEDIHKLNRYASGELKLKEGTVVDEVFIKYLAAVSNRYLYRTLSGYDENVNEIKYDRKKLIDPSELREDHYWGLKPGLILSEIETYNHAKELEKRIEENRGKILVCRVTEVWRNDDYIPPTKEHKYYWFGKLLEEGDVIVSSEDIPFNGRLGPLSLQIMPEKCFGNNFYNSGPDFLESEHGNHIPFIIDGRIYHRYGMNEHAVYGFTLELPERKAEIDSILEKTGLRLP